MPFYLGNTLLKVRSDLIAVSYGPLNPLLEGVPFFCPYYPLRKVGLFTVTLAFRGGRAVSAHQTDKVESRTIFSDGLPGGLIPELAVVIEATCPAQWCLARSPLRYQFLGKL